MACLRKGKSDEHTKKERLNAQKMDIDLPYLPEDMIIEHVLTRSSPRTLCICSSVSKLWYNSIYNDARFAASHFVLNQNRQSLFFNLLNQPLGDTDMNAYLFRLDIENHNDAFKFRRFMDINDEVPTELVGYCNGLACVKLVTKDPVTAIIVVNPIRDDQLCIYHPNFTKKVGYIPLCHGFGFDSLSQEYKVVLILSSRTNNEFVCAVYTLGTSDWRLTSTLTADISPPPGSPAFPDRMVIRISRKACNSSTLCRGDLFWRITNEDGNNIGILLSFDLHSEKIQFIRLPAIATPTQIPFNVGECLVVDHHLLVFKGYPCIAHVENTSVSCLSLFCARCCSCKIVLYLLKDKVKQEWIKAETFDISPIKDHERLVPNYFRCNANAILECTSPVSGITPTPMRLLTFSGQVLMYWYDGAYLVLYNLHTKHLKVVKGSRYYRKISSSYKDYQLHAQVENLRTLKTLIPKGETIEYSCHDDFSQSVATKKPAGWVITGRGVPKYHVFF